MPETIDLRSHATLDISGEPPVPAAANWAADQYGRVPPRRAYDASIAAARAPWKAVQDVDGTPAGAFMHNRGILGKAPQNLGYDRVARFRCNTSLDAFREPALVARLQDATGRTMAVQRTYLDERGRVRRPAEPVETIGLTRSCAIRLDPAAGTVMLTVGIDEALALRLLHPGTSVWAAGSRSDLPTVLFPDEVERIVLCGSVPDVRRGAFERALTVHSSRGLSVAIRTPMDGAGCFGEEWIAAFG